MWMVWARGAPDGNLELVARTYGKSLGEPQVLLKILGDRELVTTERPFELADATALPVSKVGLAASEHYLLTHRGGDLELRPLLPEFEFVSIHGVPTRDGRALLLTARETFSERWRRYWVDLEDRLPQSADVIELTPGEPLPGPEYIALATAYSPNGRWYAFAFSDRSSATHQVNLVSLDPSPEPVFTEMIQGDPLSLHLSDERLTYQADLDNDGVSEVMTRNLADLDAAPVLVSSVVSGTRPLRVAWSSDDRRMVYWTGDEIGVGELYFVSFEGPEVSPPRMVTTPELLAFSQVFGFDADGDIFYTISVEGERRGFAHVDLSSGETAQPVNVALPGVVLSHAWVYDGDQLLYVARTSDERCWLTWASLSGPAPGESVRLLEGCGFGFFHAVFMPSEERIVLGIDRRGVHEVWSVDPSDPGGTLERLDAEVPEGFVARKKLVAVPGGSEVLFGTHHVAEARPAGWMRVPVRGGAPRWVTDPDEMAVSTPVFMTYP